GIGLRAAAAAQGPRDGRGDAAAYRAAGHHLHQHHYGKYHRNAGERVGAELADEIGFHEADRRLYHHDEHIGHREPQQGGGDRRLEQRVRPRIHAIAHESCSKTRQVVVIAAATMPLGARFLMSPPNINMMYVILLVKKSANYPTDELARGLADFLGKLRIVHRASDHKRTNHACHHGHGLVVRGLLSPIRELALNEPDHVLDAALDGAPNFLLLTRHLAARGGERAAHALLGRLDVRVEEIGIYDGHQLLTWFRSR